MTDKIKLKLKLINTFLLKKKNQVVHSFTFFKNKLEKLKEQALDFLSHNLDLGYEIKNPMPRIINDCLIKDRS